MSIGFTPVPASESTWWLVYDLYGLPEKDEPDQYISEVKVLCDFCSGTAYFLDLVFLRNGCVLIEVHF